MIEAINKIKAANKNVSQAEMINLIARYVSNKNGMNMQMATAFAASQVRDWQGLDIAR